MNLPFCTRVAPLLVALAATAAPLGAHAAGEVTAKVLVEYCGVKDDDPDAHTAIAFCYGYIDAALDYRHAILPDGRRITCPPGTVTRKDLALAVVEWAKVHTDKVDESPPVHVVMQAAADTWPCEKE